MLLVEDETPLRELYSELLEDEHFVVTAISDGQEAQRRIQSEKFDMILLDIMLPHLNGFRILESVKKGRNFETPVLLLTNLAQENVISQCMSIGACGFILKSNYNPEEFIIAVRAFLQKSHDEKK